MASPLRLVLDTNTLVSALLFRSGRLAWLRHAWQCGQVTPLVCTATVAELLRVLTYPKFALERGDIDELLAEFLPFAETVALPEHSPPTPPCRDPDDQVFIDLAVTAAADGVVTGDGDLLAVANAMTMPVRLPAEWRKALEIA